MTRSPRFRGAITALVTPFDRSGRVHEDHLREIVERQIAGGVDGLAPCGTTGEAPTLEPAEHLRVCELTVRYAEGRAKVLAGGGGNSTRHAIELTREAARMGADGVLSVGPYYNKPSQEGHFQHYKAIAESADLPIIIYNIPGRTGVNMLPETLLRLAEIPNIAGVKEASGDLDQMMEILRNRPDGFSVLSGDDSFAIPLMAMGGDGCISVVANQVPDLFARMIHLALENDWTQARDLHYRLYELMQANFLETNPVPVKAALSMMGWIEEVYRLPLVPLQPENRRRLEGVLQRLGLIRRSTP
ncbi:MAG: 4-hydroxy-tetrahydrodipicolinate synthase [Acidobacteria bacterium]|nr:4-hydroxy-tetrahydrodipicolinate synthase [Acidobacteriota bacterium]